MDTRGQYDGRVKTQFKHGNGGRPKGAIAKKTRVIATLGMNYADAAAYMETTAFDRFVRELEALNGRDYVTAYLSLLEYIKPKLGRIELIEKTVNNVVEVFGKSIEPQTDITDIEDITQE